MGDSEQYGFEAEVNLKVTEHLTLMAALGAIDAEWNGGTLVDFDDSSVDLSGTDVPNTNDTSWMLSALYNAPLPAASEIRFVAGVQVSHSGSLLGLQAWDTVKNPSYTVANAQLGLQGEQWEVLVQVENFTDEEYYTDVQRFPNLHDPVFGPAEHQHRHHGATTAGKRFGELPILRFGSQLTDHKPNGHRLRLVTQACQTRCGGGRA